MITKEEKQEIKELLKNGESVNFCNANDFFDLTNGFNSSFCLMKNGKPIKSTKNIIPIFAALEKNKAMLITIS